MATAEWQQTESDGTPMPMHVSTPDGGAVFPAVVVIQHQSGVDQFIQTTTRRLADAGFVAAAPDLYHRDGPNCPDDMRTRSSRLSDRRVIADVGATVDFLKRHRAVDAKRIGIIGFCMGG
ncbi:MAG: dienelactone hydrolase family protein, partial [Candidatus Binatia bacterium]